MNTAVQTVLPDAFAREAALLAVAWRLQLTPTQHRLCVERYEALAAYVDRAGSPLAGLVGEVYPSGSFAIRAVILAWVSRESHDFDAVLEIAVASDKDPEEVLDDLYKAVRGEPSSRYYDKTQRNSRCVTVTYADGVKLDLMPVARLPDGLPRSAVLFHHRAAEAQRIEERYHKPVNPWGFAEHFKQSVPHDPPAFALRAKLLREEITRRHLANKSTQIDNKAETQPVPTPVPVEEKPPRLIALQLLKRYRDRRYRRRDHAVYRRPPSVVLAALALEVAQCSETLDEELLVLTRHSLHKLREADRNGKLLDVRNPVFDVDQFTDRWPDGFEGQRLWIEDLEYLEGELVALRKQALHPSGIRNVMADLFGESVAESAVEGMMTRHKVSFDLGQTGLDGQGRIANVTAAGIAAGTGGAAASSPTPVQAPPQKTFYGGRLNNDPHH